MGIRDKAIESGKIDIDGVELEYFITECPVSSGYNGYIVFPKRPTIEEGFSGILNYVPVHGGITLSDNSEEGMIYGFDTAHYDSADYPISDVGWIKSQIQIMARGIIKATEVEKKYLRCTTNKGKAKYAQIVLDTTEEPYLGFGALLNILIGRA